MHLGVGMCWDNYLPKFYSLGTSCSWGAEDKLLVWQEKGVCELFVLLGFVCFGLCFVVLFFFFLLAAL